MNPASGLDENSTPLDCYMKFVSADTFDRIAEETNSYAKDVLDANPPSPSSPAQKWSSTTRG